MQDELEASRERLRGMLNRSSLAVAFDEDHFRAAISRALRIAGSEPLRARVSEQRDLTHPEKARTCRFTTSLRRVWPISPKSGIVNREFTRILTNNTSNILDGRRKSRVC
jgi:hypothetical protein